MTGHLYTSQTLGRGFGNYDYTVILCESIENNSNVKWVIKPEGFQESPVNPNMQKRALSYLFLNVNTRIFFQSAKTVFPELKPVHLVKRSQDLGSKEKHNQVLFCRF